MTCKRGCCIDQKSHYRSIVIAGAPSSQTVQTRQADADMDAYRRLRQDGLQPKSITGSAALEKAADVPFEIESGRLTRNRKLAGQVQAVADIARNPETFTPLPGTS